MNCASTRHTAVRYQTPDNNCACTNVSVFSTKFPYIKSKCVEQRIDPVMGGCEPFKKIQKDLNTYKYVPCSNPHGCGAF